MVDTLWADVSEFQPDINDQYPYHFLAFRSSDGTYIDPHFTRTLAWAARACDTGKLAGFLVYFVYEENAAATLATFKRMVGPNPHPKMAVMIDAESWNGRIRGDHSASLNWVREEVIKWLGSYMSPLQRLRKMHRKRVVGYGNAGDLAELWPRRGDAKFVVANYSQLPVFAGMLAHQFSDRYPIPPFGNCDVNTANGMSPQQLAAALGLGKVTLPPTKPVVGLPVVPVVKPVTPPVVIPAPKPVTPPVTVPVTKPVTAPVSKPPALKPAPKPKPHPSPLPLFYVVHSGDTLRTIAMRHKTTWAKLARLNHLPNPNVIYVGQHLRVR